MSGYDEIQGFEYWNPEAWRSFVRDHILPLHASTSKLLKFRDFVLGITGTEGKTTLSEVKRKEEKILKFLLGGIKENGEYSNNSLAGFVKLALGIYIDAKKWVALEKEEELRAYDYVTVESKSTPFLEFLQNLNVTTRNIIYLVGMEPSEASENEIKEIINNPNKLLEIIKTIYSECLHVSANHSYYTFFALSTQCLPYKFLIEAYPKLQPNFTELIEFLGIRILFEPDIHEEKLRKDFSLWGHKGGRLCGTLLELNNLIWENFKEEKRENIRSVFRYIGVEVRNLKQEYKEHVKSKITWPPKDEDVKIFYEWENYIEVEGPLITWGAHRSLNLPLSDFLTKVAPGLFLGLAKIKSSSNSSWLDYYPYALGE